MTAASRRRRLLLWSVLPVLLVLCAAAKLLSVGILADRAAQAFAAGDPPAVGSAAAALGIANVLEPYKAPFAAGDAAVLAGDFGAARAAFEQALAGVPRGSGDECLVRINLVLVIERLGDDKLRAADPASAVALFQDAVAVLGESPAGCFTAGAPAGASGALADARERLAGKLDAAGRAAAPQDGTPGDPASDNPPNDGSQSQREQLQDSARQAERQRNSAREREEYLDGDPAPAPERPW
ncbi:hypothetical protein [Arthrobacter sp. C152]